MDNFYHSKDIKNIFGLNLQKIRKSKNLKQEAVAADLGISTNSLSKLENGVTWPHANLLNSIVEYFKLPAFLFFMDTDRDFEAYKTSVIENVTNNAINDYDKISEFYKVDTARKRSE